MRNFFFFCVDLFSLQLILLIFIFHFFVSFLFFFFFSSKIIKSCLFIVTKCCEILQGLFD